MAALTIKGIKNDNHYISYLLLKPAFTKKVFVDIQMKQYNTYVKVLDLIRCLYR
jgi:hypothetical protein